MLQSISRFTIGTAIGAGFVGLAIAQPGFAQTYNANPTSVNAIEDLQNSQSSSDPFNSRSSNPTKGVLDLIHNAVLGPSRSLDEFGAEQQGNLNSEASDYLKRRQAELQRQAQGNGTVGVTPPIRFVPAEGAAPASEPSKSSSDLLMTPTSSSETAPAPAQK